MGKEINHHQLQELKNSDRLLIYTVSDDDELQGRAVSINKILAEKLLKIKPSRRTFLLERCFAEIIDTLPADPVIKDIDVMFNPEYKIDVLRIMISMNKSKRFSVLWPGRYADGKLYYSEASLLDYKMYDIEEYDIYCVV